MAASDKEDSYLLLVLSEQVKENVKELSECDNVKGESESNNNKSKDKCDSYSYFYGSDAEDTDSDAEDTDEEDWPQIDDEARRRRHLERGPHKKLCEEIRRMNTFECSLHYKIRLESQNWPKPPPPQPLPLPPPPSLDFQEELRLLIQHVEQLRNLRHPGLESPC